MTTSLTMTNLDPDAPPAAWSLTELLPLVTATVGQRDPLLEQNAGLQLQLHGGELSGQRLIGGGGVRHRGVSHRRPHAADRRSGRLPTAAARPVRLSLTVSAMTHYHDDVMAMSKSNTRGLAPVHLFVATALALCACDSEGKEEKVGSCTPDQLANGHVIASKTLTRSKGQPLTEYIPFSIAEYESACVVVSTGPNGEPAPASLRIWLDDSVEVASPNDFNSSSKTLFRELGGDILEPGQHELSIRLAGKGGKDPGVAHVAIIGFGSDPEQDTSSVSLTLTSDRLENPEREWTVVKDEATVTFMDFHSIEDVTAKLQTLGFPAHVIGHFATVPKYQIFLPGTEGGDALRAKVSELETLEGVAHTSLHYIGGVADFGAPHLPDKGNDTGYISESNGALLAAGWHLNQIRAPYAWTDSNVSSPISVGVIDGGFNPEHPDLIENIAGKWWGNKSTTKNSDILPPEAKDQYPICNRVTPEACAEWKKCSSSSPDHGTAMAGLLAARGNNHYDQDHANAVGILWNTNLHLAKYDYAELDGDPIYSSVGVQSGVDKMAVAGVRVISMSFGFSPLCNTSPYVGFLNPDLAKMSHADLNVKFKEIRDDERDDWTDLVRRNNQLLLVQAAGNSGVACGDREYPASWCEAGATGHACAIEAPDASKRVICVGGSTQTGEFFTKTNARQGSLDMLLAPAKDVYHITRFGIQMSPQSGTSSATPMVAGAAALLLGINPEMNPRVLHDILLTGGPLSITDSGQTRRPVLDLEAAVQQTHRCMDKYVALNVGLDGCGRFPDVPTNIWFFKPVETLACNCIIDGHPNGDFDPLGEINRAEALKIVLRLAFPLSDFSEAPAENPYDDVPKGEWYAPYAKFAQDLGIITFNQGKLIHPGQAITRSEFVKLVVLAAEKSPGVLKLSNLFAAKAFVKLIPPSGDDVYVDVPVGNENLHIYAASAQCVVTGYDDNNDGIPDQHFGPDDPLSRAQAAKIGCLAMYGHGSIQCGAQSPGCTPIIP
jgi:subtilisin family serine protease